MADKLFCWLRTDSIQNWYITVFEIGDYDILLKMQRFFVIKAPFQTNFGFNRENLMDCKKEQPCI